MYKKFLNAILFGALILGSAGTITSCKDYDDEIDEINQKLGTLSSKDELSAQIGTLTSAVNAAAAQAQQGITDAAAAKTAAEAAATVAKAAGDEAAAAAAQANIAKAAADKAAAEAKAAALAEVKAQLESINKDIKDLKESSSKTGEDALKKLNEAVEKAKKDLENITGKIADAVTSISLVYSDQLQDGFYGTDLELSTVVEKDNVFSKGVENAITFVKGTQHNVSDYFVVRVSPTNAVLSEANISLVNSKGESLDDILEVTGVAKVDQVLTRANESGLWVVGVALKDGKYEAKSFAAATTITDAKKVAHPILFAAQVNNTAATAEKRFVTSEYDLTLGWAPFEPARELNFTVNKTPVADINNRYDENSISFYPYPNPDQDYQELTWAASTKTAPTPDVAAVTKGDKKNVANDEADNRSDKQLFPAVQGQPLNIELFEEVAGKKVAPAGVRAIYVVLDEENAVESAPSELNAWRSYKYTNLNQVIEGTTITVSINSDEAINDIIGFRVYAVNWDGTLVDPDGKAFYVELGNGQEVAGNATVITPTHETENVTAAKSATAAMTINKVKATTLKWTTDKIGDNTPVFKAVFVDAKGNIIFTSDDTTAPSADDLAKVAKVYTQPLLSDWKLYEDNKVYTGTLVLQNVTETTTRNVATIKVTMQKVLPTTAPAGYSPKTSQIVEGIYNSYLEPDNWTADAATKGTMPMTDVFNFGKTSADVTSLAPNYNITFAAAKKDAKGNLLPVTVKGDETLEVDKAFIDNTTKHATTVVYNYGKISSVKNAKGGYDDVIINVDSFQTIFDCIYNNTYSWHWMTLADYQKISGNAKAKQADLDALYTNTVQYGIDGEQTVSLEYILGVSTRDSRYSAALSEPYEGSLEVKSATLTSDANGKQEYFGVSVSGTSLSFAQRSDATNPTADVKSTLTINAVDSYGHKVAIKVPMTVLKR